MGTSLRADKHFGESDHKRTACHMRPAAQPAFSQPLPVRAQVRGLLFVHHHCSIRTTLLLLCHGRGLFSSLVLFFFGLCAFDPYGWSESNMQLGIMICTWICTYKRNSFSLLDHLPPSFPGIFIRLTGKGTGGESNSTKITDLVCNDFN